MFDLHKYAFCIMSGNEFLSFRGEFVGGVVNTKYPPNPPRLNKLKK